jgi:hypothetical protein
VAIVGGTAATKEPAVAVVEVEVELEVGVGEGEVLEDEETSEFKTPVTLQALKSKATASKTDAKTILICRRGLLAMDIACS